MTTVCHRVHTPRGLDLRIALDQRRHQPPAVVETILALSRNAPREDRAILEAVFGEGRTIAEIAACANERPRCVRRRLRRAIARVIDPRFVFVCAAWREWPRPRRRVATLHILGGHTMRETARLLGITEHAVRRECAAIDTLLSQHHEAAGGSTPIPPTTSGTPNTPNTTTES